MRSKFRSKGFVALFLLPPPPPPRSSLFFFSGIVEDVRMLRVVYSFRGDVNENSLSLDSVKELILVLLVFFSKNRLVRC